MAKAATSTATARKPQAERVAPVLTTVAAAGILTMPARNSNRGSKTNYPFESLTAVGMAFGVKNKKAVNLSSIISNQNRKPGPNVVDANGAIVYKVNEIKDANGAVVGRVPTNEAETGPSKHYFAVDVDKEMAAKIKGTPLDGSSVIVFRDR